LAEGGKLSDRVGIKTLSDMKANTVMEVLTCKTADTRNGEAVAATVILPEHATTRGETTLFLPLRFWEECERKVPCLLYYGGVKALDGGKRCHDVKLIKADDGVVFHESDDEGVAGDAWTEDEDDEGKTIEYHMTSVADFEPTCPTCGQRGEACPGPCDRCNEHQPINGSQCRCCI
jgi:hypothetical protein